MVLLFFVIFTVALISYNTAPVVMSYEFIFFQIIIMIIQVSCFAFAKDLSSIKRYPIRHSTVFLIGFLIVYYQCDIDFLLGNIDETLNYVWVDTTAVCKALSLSNMTLSTYFVGYYIFALIFKKVCNTNKVVYCSNMLEFFMLLVLLLYFITINKSYLFGGYPIQTMGGVATEMAKMFEGLLTTALAIRSIQIRKSNDVLSFYGYYTKMKFLLITALVYVISILMSGARHPALSVLFLILISFIYTTRFKFSFIKIFVPLLLFSTIFTLVGIVRSDSFDGNLSSIELTRSISPLTRELANSVNTLHCAVAYFPNVLPYNYGLTLVSFPFLIIPGGRALVLKILGIPLEQSASTYFLTELMLGDNPSYGVGSSSIADIFISFGPYGVIILFFLFGFLVRFLEKNTFTLDSVSPYILILSFSIFSELFYVSRESLFSILFGISYPLVFYFIFSHLRYSLKVTI